MVDGLKGLAEAITTVYLQTTVQACIVHLIRNSLDYVGWKDRKPVAHALRPIYTAVSEQAAQEQLQAFADGPWGIQVPDNRAVLGTGAGARRAVLRVPARHPACDLHDQRD